MTAAPTQPTCAACAEIEQSKHRPTYAAQAGDPPTYHRSNVGNWHTTVCGLTRTDKRAVIYKRDHG